MTERNMVSLNALTQPTNLSSTQAQNAKVEWMNGLLKFAIISGVISLVSSDQPTAVNNADNCSHGKSLLFL